MKKFLGRKSVRLINALGLHSSMCTFLCFAILSTLLTSTAFSDGAATDVTVTSNEPIFRIEKGAAVAWPLINGLPIQASECPNDNTCDFSKISARRINPLTDKLFRKIREQSTKLCHLILKNPLAFAIDESVKVSIPDDGMIYDLDSASPIPSDETSTPSKGQSRLIFASVVCTAH